MSTSEIAEHNAQRSTSNVKRPTSATPVVTSASKWTDALHRADGQPLWLEVGTLFDGENLHRPGHLVFTANRIIYANTLPPRASLLRAEQAAPDVRLPDHTVIPGLIEAHAHLFLEGGEENPERRAAYLQLDADEFLPRAEARLARLLRTGVIAVRDAGDKYGVGLALQSRYRDHARRGEMPYLDSPGAAIHHAGRYGAFMGRTIEEHGDIEAAVAARIAAGAHRIKLLATGIINFQKGAVTAKPQIPAGELTRAVAAARRQGKQTFVHCSGHDGVDICLDAAVDSIEHGFFVDRDQLARMRDLDVAWVPTFAPVQYQVDHAAALGWDDTVKGNLQRILDGHATSLAYASALGVRIVAGSDAGSHGVAHGHGFLWELELMERAGLPTLEVLHAATGASSARLGYAESFGRLRAGTAPRFLLTTAPVLESVRHLRTPLTVVFDGAVLTGGDDPSQPGM